MLNRVVGDLFAHATTNATPTSPSIIMHGCNDLGAWGAGFVVPLGARYPRAREAYLAWAGWADGEALPTDAFAFATGRCVPGQVQFVRVGPQLWVANSVTQHGVGPDRAGRVPFRMPALVACATYVARFAAMFRCSVHLPRIGAGLAGGNWPEIERVLQAAFDDIDATYYVLPQEASR